MTATMTSYDVEIDKLLFLTWKKPRYQILSLKNITKGGIMVVCRSMISNFIEILRKMTNNDVNNDVIWRQKCFLQIKVINFLDSTYDVLQDRL